MSKEIPLLFSFKLRKKYFFNIIIKVNKDFTGKVVWITGASSGIGEATAYEFAKAGAKLVLSARRESELLRVKNNIAPTTTEVLILPIDIAEIDTFDQKVAAVMARFGRIDVLYNNAGISQRGSVNDSDMAVFRQLLEVNFFGVIALTKAVLPIMLKQNNGQIAVTSSVSGKLGTPMRSGYCASKHAIHGFFDSLRAEVWKNNISITLVCPGYIHTDISKNALSTDGSKHGQMDQNQANGMPVEVAAQKIVKAIATKKNEVYMGGVEILGVYLKRFFPRILSKILRNQMPR